MKAHMIILATEASRGFIQRSRQAVGEMTITQVRSRDVTAPINGATNHKHIQ